MKNDEVTDPAAARSGDKARAAGREREALRQRAEDADGWQRRAETAEAALAALTAARSAAAHRVDALYERAETAKANHDAGRRILQDLMDELAALAARSGAAHQLDFEGLPQFTQKVYSAVDDHAGREIVTVELEAVRQRFAALAAARLAQQQELEAKITECGQWKEAASGWRFGRGSRARLRRAARVAALYLVSRERPAGAICARQRPREPMEKEKAGWMRDADSYLGRCVFRDGVNYTVAGCSADAQRGVFQVRVLNPTTLEYLIFDSLETFNNWAYGTPVPSGASR